jgi:very-short-patch-repair endonuclease
MPVKNIIPGQKVIKEKLQRAKELRREMGLRIFRLRNEEILMDLSTVVGRIRELVQSNDLIQQARQQANEAGLKQKAISSAIAKARERE